MPSGKHRVIERRQCYCGEWFDVTSKHPDRKSCKKTCYGWKRALAEGNLRAWKRIRMARWKKKIDDLMARGSTTKGDLVDLCQQVYKQGYESGYHRGRDEKLGAS